MRTTIRLDENLLRAAKLAAAQSGRTLNKVIEDSLREALGRRQTGEEERQPLPTYKPRVPGLRPGVDLNDSASLWDLLDEADAAN